MIPETPKARDVTSKSSSIPRDAALLYRNRKPKNAHSPSYLCLLKMTDGGIFWAGIWVREVKGQRVLELRLSPRKERR